MFARLYCLPNLKLLYVAHFVAVPLVYSQKGVNWRIGADFRHPGVVLLLYFREPIFWESWPMGAPPSQPIARSFGRLRCEVQLVDP